MKPRFPVFIVSKGRADSRLTIRHLETMHIPFRVIVESQERDAYAKHVKPENLIVLDPAYQTNYDTCDPEGDALNKSKGPGPARNMAWDISAREGFTHHWVLDDNLAGFYRLHENQKKALGDGTFLYAMEDFVLRYRNIALSGPAYESLVSKRQKQPALIYNTRIYSCLLIKNEIPYRWRGRYNEDTDLSLRVLKAGLCTVQFVAFLQKKIWTQVMAGGNTEEFYAREGTLPKSQLLKKLHPDVTRVVWKFHRWHHQVDYTKFQNNKLLPSQNTTRETGINEFGMVLANEPYKASPLHKTGSHR